MGTDRLRWWLTRQPVEQTRAEQLVTDRYELRALEASSDWSSFHSIRKGVLWDARDMEGYDPENADDRAADNHPFLLLLDGDPIGVIRVDISPPYAILRRVAISEGWQRLGHGTELVRLAERFARESGCSIAGSHVDKEAVGFYERLGYVSIRKDDVLWMEKKL